MIVRLIAETLTPIVSKSRFLRVRGVRGIVSNRPYLEREAPTYHGCRTTLIVKQGANGRPMYRRAYLGYLHVDFKTKTRKQAERKIQALLQLQWVGRLTAWGYGVIQWMLQKTYHGPEATLPGTPRFQILKGLPPNLSHRERQLVMAALLHDLVDTERHPSKLGRPLTIPDSYVRWLCTQHHAVKVHPPNADLQCLQAADGRNSRYARILRQPTLRRKLVPVNTKPLARQLEQAAHISVHRLYQTIYHSKALHQLTASKTRPTETLRHHLIGVANWVLFWLRMPSPAHDSLATSVALAGEPGGTPGPVEMEDQQTPDEP